MNIHDGPKIEMNIDLNECIEVCMHVRVLLDETMVVCNSLPSLSLSQGNETARSFGNHM
jgi:hypothetical protein